MGDYGMMVILVLGAAGIGLAIGLAAYQGRLRTPSHGLSERVEQVLQHGERSLPEIVRELGTGGFDAHVNVSMVLDDLVTRGRLTVIPPPDGTPDVERVEHTKYRLSG